MYQVVITVDSQAEDTTGKTGFNVRTMADLSRTFNGELTSVDAAELGVVLALSRFVRGVLSEMPHLIVADLGDTEDFDTVVGLVRGQILEALVDGAGDWVRETLGLTEPSQEPGDDIDWNLAFKHLIKGERDA